MKMNINHVFDHDEGHYTSLVKMGSYRKNKNEEEWDAFVLEMNKKKGITRKMSLLTSWYEHIMKNLHDDPDCYNEDGVFIPPFTLEYFIEHNEHYSERQLIRIMSFDD